MYIVLSYKLMRALLVGGWQKTFQQAHFVDIGHAHLALTHFHSVFTELMDNFSG